MLNKQQDKLSVNTIIYMNMKQKLMYSLDLKAYSSLDKYGHFEGTPDH